MTAREARPWRWLLASSLLGCGDVTTVVIERDPTTEPDCESQPDCEEEADTPHCNVEAGVCVECLVQTDCAEADEDCNPVRGICAVPCTIDSTCDADDPICDPDIGFCVACRTDQDCGPGSFCRAGDCFDER